MIMDVGTILVVALGTASGIYTWKITKKWRHKFVDSLSDEALSFWAFMPFAIVFMPIVFMLHFPMSMIPLIIQAGFLCWQILCNVIQYRRFRRPKEVGGGSCSYNHTFKTKEQENG